MAAAREGAASARPAAVFDSLGDQPRVRDLLASAVREGRLSHAYLFVGAPGSGMEEAALALAQCVVCPNDGCGTCDDCRRVLGRAQAALDLHAGDTRVHQLPQVRDVVHVL